MTTDEKLVAFAQALTDFTVAHAVTQAQALVEIDGRQFTVLVGNSDELTTETKEFTL